MNIHVQFGFIHICSFWKEGFWKWKMAATTGLSLTLDPWEKCLKTLPLWNHLDNLNQTAQEWSLEGPLAVVAILDFRTA
jgi:hypothetical protein